MFLTVDAVLWLTISFGTPSPPPLPPPLSTQLMDACPGSQEFVHSLHVCPPSVSPCCLCCPSSCTPSALSAPTSPGYPCKLVEPASWTQIDFVEYTRASWFTQEQEASPQQPVENLNCLVATYNLSGKVVQVEERAPYGTGSPFDGTVISANESGQQRQARRSIIRPQSIRPPSRYGLPLYDLPLYVLAALVAPSTNNRVRFAFAWWIPRRISSPSRLASFPTRWPDRTSR